METVSSRNLILRPALLAIALLGASYMSVAQAAPIWLERKFIPSSELVNSVFGQRDDQSEITVDHAPWGRFLSDYVSVRDDGLHVVDYESVTDEHKAVLDLYISRLGEVDVTKLNASEQLAYWINLYNAITVQLIIEQKPKSSIRDLKKPWTTPKVRVNGVDLTLHNIESGIIRPVFNDPRIHYAVNCASVGCPNLALTPYTGARVEQMLDDSARAYVNHPRGVRVDGRRLVASKIYGWYREDFGDGVPAVLSHIRKYANEDLLKRLAGKDSISDYYYDWKLNNPGARPAR